MDLTIHDNFVVSWEVVGDNVTMTFKDHTEATTLDTITIQTSRLRSFLDSLIEVALVFDPPVNEITTREYCSTKFLNSKSYTEFP
jgi:hypothetical protein